MDTFVAALFIIICILLIVVVLLQKGRGGGLGAAFGGAGSSAFGTRTGDVFTWVTVILTALFLLLAIGTCLVFREEPGKVEKPYFVPGASTADRTVRVVIRCRTSKADIHYTLDEKVPTDKSAKYHGNPVAVRARTWIKARALKPGWKDSDVAAQYYGPPTTAPAAKASKATTRPSG